MIKNLGLVVEGGGVRAMYAAGVLDVLHELRLPVAGVIGVSAGAVHGASFVSGQKGRSLRFYKTFCRDDRFFSFKNFLKTGNLVDTQFCYHDIPERLDPYDEEAFEKSGINFYVTCTDIETGQPVYLKLTNLFTQIDALRASASLPYVSEAVEFDGKKLLDGGCSDRIPVKKFQELGYQKCILVLTHPREHRVKDRDAALAPLFYRKYPNFCRTFKQSPERYEQTLRYIDEEEAKGNLFVFRPMQTISVGRLSHSPEKIQIAYNQGRLETQLRLTAFRRWLKSASEPTS